MPHKQLVDMYATVCMTCGCHTNSLMRMQAESNELKVTAPDGSAAQVVENNPDEVTFYVSSGPHEGYYTHNKNTGKNEIRAA
jgi:hypothetical protein